MARKEITAAGAVAVAQALAAWARTPLEAWGPDVSLGLLRISSSTAAGAEWAVVLARDAIKAALAASSLGSSSTERCIVYHSAAADGLG